jgi:hypothetical protein
VCSSHTSANRFLKPRFAEELHYLWHNLRSLQTCRMHNKLRRSAAEAM